MPLSRLFDPLVRQAIAAATGDEAILLEHLAQHGPSMPDDVELELGWERGRLKRVRARLERVGAVISEGLVFQDSSNWHFAPMQRWDQLVRRSTRTGDALALVVLAGVRAAVVAPESDIQSWFSWRVPTETVDALVKSGRLVRPAPGLLALAR